ncbi:hypothetical protein DL96DRAFT_1618635 [Flagelloscypha sp. PMI_526]|nr:hypothetical protein DL96DRAFT_1618635 [Flagelloscypha sp. PMI_526]
MSLKRAFTFRSNTGQSRSSRPVSQMPSQLQVPVGVHNRPPIEISEHSSPMLPNSIYCSSDFMLGAGMVIIQPSTKKVVLVFDKSLQCFFLPKGRKDVDESLEETALREAYEETGYRARFMDIYHSTRAPAPPSDPDRSTRPNHEPIYMDVQGWGPKLSHTGERRDNGGEYFVTWYLGEIDHDAVREENSTQQSDEIGYESVLLTYEEAMNNLHPKYKAIVNYAYGVWRDTETTKAKIRAYHAGINSDRSSSQRTKGSRSTGARDAVREEADLIVDMHNLHA